MVFDTLVSVADTMAYTSCVKLFIASEVEVEYHLHSDFRGCIAFMVNSCRIIQAYASKHEII